MQQEEIDALPDSLRAFVLKVGREKHVPFDAVVGAVFDGCSQAQIEAFSPERFVRFVRGNCHG